MKWKTDHKQVRAFDPQSGMFAVVDEGLADLLKIMWRLGLKTQYSCQGNLRTEEAYILMDRKSGQRFEKMMREAELSPEARCVANLFLNGPRMHDVALHVRDYEFFRWSLTVSYGFKIRPKPSKSYFKVERSYQFAPHWLRTTYRWPVDMTPFVHRMLQEL